MLVMLGASSFAQPGGTADATLVAHMLTASNPDAAAPAKGVKVKITNVDPERMTDDQGLLKVTMAPGQYTLKTVSGKHCYFDFTMAAGKTLDLTLLIPSDDGQPCVKMAARGPAAAASAAASKPIED